METKSSGSCEPSDSNTHNHSKMMTNNVYPTVLCQKDHLKLICYFLTINDIFQIIPLISQFHTQFINHMEQKQLIETCIGYDDLQGAFESLEIFPLKYDTQEAQTENTTSISKQLSNVYGIDSWSDLIATVKNTTHTNAKLNFIKAQCNRYFITDDSTIKYDQPFYNLNYLLILKNAAMVQIWLPKV